MNNKIQPELGKRIQKFRKLKGYSQEKFAEMIGIATNSLSSIETGKAFMTITTLEKILDLLEISAEELFNFSETPSSEKMYKHILSRLKLIKNNNEKLSIVFNFINSLF